MEWPEGVVKNLLSKGYISADTQSDQAGEVLGVIRRISSIFNEFCAGV